VNFFDYIPVFEITGLAAGKTKNKNARRDLASRRAMTIGYLPSGFPLDTHVAQLVRAGVIHQEVHTGQGKQEQDTNGTYNDQHRQLLSRLI
jgi:hypothetical protein